MRKPSISQPAKRMLMFWAVVLFGGYMWFAFAPTSNLTIHQSDWEKSQRAAWDNESENLALHVIYGQENGVPVNINADLEIKPDNCHVYDPDLALKYYGDSNDHRPICFSH